MPSSNAAACGRREERQQREIDRLRERFVRCYVSDENSSDLLNTEARQRKRAANQEAGDKAEQEKSTEARQRKRAEIRERAQTGIQP